MGAQFETGIKFIYLQVKYVLGSVLSKFTTTMSYKVDLGLTYFRV